MKRAYIASYTIEMAIVAESPDEAKRFAVKNLEQEFSNTLKDENDIELFNMRRLPDGWDEECCSYGESMTLSEAKKLPGGWACKEEPTP